MKFSEAENASAYFFIKFCPAADIAFMQYERRNRRKIKAMVEIIILFVARKSLRNFSARLRKYISAFDYQSIIKRRKA